MTLTPQQQKDLVALAERGVEDLSEALSHGAEEGEELYRLAAVSRATVTAARQAFGLPESAPTLSPQGFHCVHVGDGWRVIFSKAGSIDDDLHPSADAAVEAACFAMDITGRELHQREANSHYELWEVANGR